MVIYHGTIRKKVTNRKKKTSLRIHHNLGPQKFQRFCRKPSIPIQIHGTIVYLPCIWLISVVNVGKYTSPMDPMGMVMDDFTIV